MQTLSELLIRTVSQGGALLFLEEGSTPSLQNFLAALCERKLILSGWRSLENLQQGLMSVQAKDLLFVGKISLAEQQILARFCNCQIYYESGEVVESLGDFSGEKFLQSAPEGLAKGSSSLDEEFAPTAAGYLSETMTSYYLQALTDLDKFLHDPRTVQNKLIAKENISRVLFLDRDDVVIKNIPYNKDPAQVALLPGVGNLIRRAHSLSYLVIVCSNQSGLGRGLIQTSEYLQVHQKMLSLLSQQSAWLEDVLWASYIDSATEGVGCLAAHWRKPRPGMFLEAATKWSVDMSASLMVGDSAGDLLAAHSAGVERLFLLKSEKSEKEKALLKRYQQQFSFEYRFIHSLDEIVL